MYLFIINVFRPYTLAYIIMGVAIANLWRKRQETKGRMLLITFGFAMMTLLSLPAVDSSGTRIVGMVIPSASTLAGRRWSHCRAFRKLRSSGFGPAEGNYGFAEPCTAAFTPLKFTTKEHTYPFWLAAVESTLKYGLDLTCAHHSWGTS